MQDFVHQQCHSTLEKLTPSFLLASDWSNEVLRYLHPAGAQSSTNASSEQEVQREASAQIEAVVVRKVKAGDHPHSPIAGETEGDHWMLGLYNIKKIVGV